MRQVRHILDLDLEDFDPLSEKPTTLAQYTVAARCLERIEDERGIWREHWQLAGINRKARRAMRALLLRNIGREALPTVRSIIKTSRHVKTHNKLAATLAAERKADLMGD